VHIHRPQAVFFDFDGVLVDSTTIKNEAFRDLFRQFGDEVVREVLDYHRQHGGISRVEKIRYAFGAIMKADLSEKRLQQLADTYSSLVVDKVVEAGWIAGAKSFLERTCGRFPMFVISGTPEDELRLIISRRKMAHYFTEILGSPKKKPEHLQRLCTVHELNPRQCVFIGDAGTDYHAAVQFDMPFIGIQGEYRFPDHVHVLPDCTGLQSSIDLLFAAPS